MHDGGTIIIKAGQLLTGREALARDSGLTPSTVERILKYLENEQQIEQQKTTKYRVITILNWDTYQKVDSKADNKRTADGQQTDTNKNVKKIKNEKKDPTAQGAGVLVSELIKAFEGVDPKNKTYYGNTNQRKAADFLIKEYGLEEVMKRVSVLPRTNKVPYFPTITTPVQLRDKWVQLGDAVERRRGELSTKGRGLA